MASEAQVLHTVFNKLFCNCSFFGAKLARTLSIQNCSVSQNIVLPVLDRLRKDERLSCRNAGVQYGLRTVFPRFTASASTNLKVAANELGISVTFGCK